MPALPACSLLIDDGTVKVASLVEWLEDTRPKGTGGSQAAQMQPLGTPNTMIEKEKSAINRAELGDAAQQRITVRATSGRRR